MRGPSARILFWCCAATCLVMVVVSLTAALQKVDWVQLGFALAFLCLGVLCVGMAIRPRIALTESALEIRNLGRSTVFPWAEVEEAVPSVYGVQIVLRSGETRLAIAVQRTMVHDNATREMALAITERAQRFRAGDPTGPTG